MCRPGGSDVIYASHGIGVSAASLSEGVLERHGPLDLAVVGGLPVSRRLTLQRAGWEDRPRRKSQAQALGPAPNNQAP